VIDEIPLASLPDLAFLLLIFFITSTIFTVEHGLPLVLPSAKRSPRISVEPHQVFRIQGLADGTVNVDGTPTRLEDVAPMLRSRNDALTSRGQSELIVIIETHPEAPYALMVAILDRVRAANSRRVALQVLEES
jgi:biopolymer transport protein ExbD